MVFAFKLSTSKFFRTASLCAALAVSGLLTGVQPAMAIKGDHARFATCQQLKANNTLRWHGIASGTEDSAFAVFEYARSFHTKACFSNERACRTWVKRIWWEIPTMDELRTAYCKPV